MTRVRYYRPMVNYVSGSPVWPWFSSWIERPRLLASGVAASLCEPSTICDPACGDGSVVLTAHRLRPISQAYLSDISPGVITNIVPKTFPFPAEVNVADAYDILNRLPSVDCVVLTEILEHLEDPDSLLRLARTKARWLVASSPILPAGVEDPTDQHLWSFDLEGYREMLEQADWHPRVWFVATARDHPYADGFQVWGASKDP